MPGAVRAITRFRSSGLLAAADEQFYFFQTNLLSGSSGNKSSSSSASSSSGGPSAPASKTESHKSRAKLDVRLVARACARFPVASLSVRDGGRNPAGRLLLVGVHHDGMQLFALEDKDVVHAKKEAGTSPQSANPKVSLGRTHALT